MKNLAYDKGYRNSYNSKTFQRIIEEFVNTILLKYCNDPDKIVCSLGCHDDILAEQIQFKELYLVDMKFGQCYHKDNPHIHYFEDTIENIVVYRDFQKYIDVILMTNVVEHIDGSSLYFIFNNIKHMLTSNGIFIFTIPNARSINRLIGVELGMLENPYELSETDKIYGHKRMYCYNYMSYFERLLKMKKIEDIGIMFKPLSLSQMDKYFSNNLDTFIQIGYDLGQKMCSYIGAVFKNI